MEKSLRAPGDFAQAYVIAHEVGHHVQNLIGSTRLQPNGETSNQASVRVELQADCFAGVWGRSAQSALEITDEDLGEALTAAHAIGDDTLGHSDERKFTHGSSEQRKRCSAAGSRAAIHASATRLPCATIANSEPRPIRCSCRRPHAW